MKKVLFVVATVVGLVAAPTAVLARHGADDTVSANDVRQEDRRNDNPTPAATVTPTQSTQTTNSVTAEQAQAAAQAMKPGATVTKVETETEHGTAVFSVRFNDNSRVDIDAATGTVAQDDDMDDDTATPQDDHRGHSGQHNGSSTSGRNHNEG